MKDIVPVQSPDRQVTVSQCADEKPTDCCILKVKQKFYKITNNPFSKRNTILCFLLNL